MPKISAFTRARVTKGLVATVAAGALAVTGVSFGTAVANATPVTSTPSVVYSPTIGVETDAGYPSSPFFYGENSATPTGILPVSADGDLEVPGGVQLLHQFPSLPATGAGLIAAETPTALADFIAAGAGFTIDGTGTASFQLPLVYGPNGSFTTLRTDDDYSGSVGTDTAGWTTSHDIGTPTDPFYLAANTSAPLATIVSDIEAVGSQELLAYGLQVTSAVPVADVASISDGGNEYAFASDLTTPASTSTTTAFVPDFAFETSGGFAGTNWFYGDKGAVNVPSGTVLADGSLEVSPGTQILHPFPNLATATPTVGALRAFVEAGSSWTGGTNGLGSFQLPFYYVNALGSKVYDTLYTGDVLGSGVHNMEYADHWRLSHAVPTAAGGTINDGTLAQLLAAIDAIGPDQQELVAFGYEATAAGGVADVKSIQIGTTTYAFDDQLTLPSAASASTVDVGGIGLETAAGYPAQSWFFGLNAAKPSASLNSAGDAVIGGGTQLLHQFSATTEPTSLRAFIKSGVNFTTTAGTASFQVPLVYGPSELFTTLRTADDLSAGNHIVQFTDNWTTSHAIPATASTAAIAANSTVTLTTLVNAIEAQGGTQSLDGFGVQATTGVGVTLASVQAEGTKYTFVDNPKLAFSSLTITGTVVVGKTLTAVPKIVNPNGVSYTYQWYYDGSQKIIGATGPTYKIAASMFGRVISVRVTATKPGHVTATAMSDLTAPVLKGTFAAATAHITGTLRVANVVSASLSTSPMPTRLSFQWYADGSAIRGATSRSYKIAAAWAGSSLRVRIIASASGYVPLSTMSAPTAPVAFGRLVLGTPKLLGVAKVGHTLTAKKGACTSGTKVEYWFTADDNKFDAVQVSTKNTFTIPASLVGKRITVYVSGTRAGYGFSFSAPSKPTKAIVK